MTRDEIDQTVAFIGFGEAAQAILDGWQSEGPVTGQAFDIKIASPEDAIGLRKAADERGIRLTQTPEAALAGARVVFCLVTAASARNAAEAAARSGALGPGTLWFDGNSCSPGAKREAAEVIEAAGARYIDLAIMAPVHPLRHKVPILLSGPHAEAGEACLSALGMAPVIAGDTVGHGSTIKMLRSVMVKGMEALSAECFLAARAAGLTDTVAASLTGPAVGDNWQDRAAYNLERMATHGRRRAEEMREVVRTLEELGIAADMTRGTVDWQDRLAGRADLQRLDGLASRLDALGLALGLAVPGA